MSKKKVTFDDIAKYTNFSKTTISRYFNNPDSLTVKNQEIIAQALVDLDYQENKLAKVLANGKSEFIGVIIPNLFLHYYAEMLNQILKTYETFGYKFLVFVSTEREETERKYIQELLAYKIEGMIILSHTIPSKELAASNIPIVTIEREDQYVNSVNTDNYMGAVQATSLLAKSDCDVLLHINSDVPETTPSYGRISGFQRIPDRTRTDPPGSRRYLSRNGKLPAAYLAVYPAKISREKERTVYGKRYPRQYHVEYDFSRIRDAAG